MKSILKKILFLYILIVIIKVILSYFIKHPTIFADSYIYIRGARNLLLLGQYTVHGLPILKYPPLYSLILSISYIFHDMNWIYFFMKVINSFLSSLVIIPAYLISREFLSKRKSILIALLTGILPHNFLISNYIMSENLFYPLFLFSVYFIYKTLNEKQIKWSILAGIFLGLCNLTRIQGLIFFPLVFILFLSPLSGISLLFPEGRIMLLNKTTSGLRLSGDLSLLFAAIQCVVCVVAAIYLLRRAQAALDRRD